MTIQQHDPRPEFRKPMSARERLETTFKVIEAPLATKVTWFPAKRILTVPPGLTEETWDHLLCRWIESGD